MADSPPVSYPPPPHGPQQPPAGYGQPPYGYYLYQQPHFTPPPKIDPKRLRPSRTWYWVSGGVAFLAAVLAIVYVVQFVEQLDPDIDNFRANEAAEVELGEGDRAIYIQTRDAGTPIFVPPDAVTCRVSSLDGGDVPLRRRAGSTLDADSDSYAREYSFDAPRDGRYRVFCEGPARTRMAIGPDLSFGLFAPLIYATAVFVLGLFAAGAIALVTGIRRSNHKRRLQREEMASGPA